VKAMMIVSTRPGYFPAITIDALSACIQMAQDLAPDSGSGKFVIHSNIWRERIRTKAIFAHRLTDLLPNCEIILRVRLGIFTDRNGRTRDFARLGWFEATTLLVANLNGVANDGINSRLRV
jgi:hypothetical protein